MSFRSGLFSSLIEGVTRWWRSRSLAQQFLFASAVTILIAMVIVGSWLTQRIVSAVTQNSALDAALYVESVVGERIQGLAEKREFEPKVQDELEKLVLQTPLGRRILSFKVWVKGGRVIYASTPEHVGKTFTPTRNLIEAWRGSVRFEFDHLHDDENVIERKFNVPLLEIYVPVRGRFGGEVIAIVEFYEDASGLVYEMALAKWQAWLLLAGVGVFVVAALYGMAWRASYTIDVQRSALRSQISELSSLRDRIEASSKRAAELNERFLRRIGSDLHDGPAQLISLALFRLDAVGLVAPRASGIGAIDLSLVAAEKAKIRQALEGALKEIRDLSAGLSAPELDALSLASIIRNVVRAHEHRTETRVSLEIGPLPPTGVDRERKLAAYRFVQEALNNTRRHAAGSSVSVMATAHKSGTIAIEVRDDGPGFDSKATTAIDRLGIVGLRQRIEGIGGTLQIDTGLGSGTRLLAIFPVVTGDQHDE